MPRLRSLAAPLLAAALLVSPATFGAGKSAQAINAAGDVRSAAGQVVVQFDRMDASKAAQAEEDKMGVAYRFATRAIPAEAVRASKGLVSHGEWASVNATTKRWTIRVDAPGALSLNLAFRKFWLPAGASVVVRDLHGSVVLGPYTDRDIKSHGELWTPLVVGDSVTVEVTSPSQHVDSVSLELASVQRGFRDPFAPRSAAKSGSCNVDTICPEGDDWRRQIRGVSRYIISGSFFCTGTLINSAVGASETRRNYFLTADHCFRDGNDNFQADDARSIVFYWNYESATCRTVGSNGNGQPVSDANAVTQSGSRVVANRTGTDFTLLELDDPPPSSAQVYFVGWDRSNSTPSSGGVSIHHPAGDEKRISFEDDALTVGDRPDPGGETDAYWIVNDWDLGTTEGGSSGSALFDLNGRLIGQLYGGFAACGNDLEDYYGRIGDSWQGTSPETRLRDWLDPNGTAGNTLNGTDGCSLGDVSIDASANSVGVGELVTFAANVSGSTSGYTFEWDFNDDGFPEATGQSVETHFPGVGTQTVSVTIDDGQNCQVKETRGQEVTGPVIELTDVGTPDQLCGDNDAVIEPGERWRIPVEFTNTGDASGEAYGVFTAATGTAKLLSLADGGYDAADETASGCRYSAVDISGSGQQLDMVGGNDDGAAVVQLGGYGLSLFGDRVGQVAMSTNGYLSLDATDDGGDWSNDCPLPARPNLGSLSGSRIMALHDDLVIDDAYYQYFDTCPRSPDGGGSDACHVFQWSGAGFFVSNQAPDGDFDVVALVYVGSGDIVYQYSGDNPRAGASGTIAVQSGGQESAATYSCSIDTGDDATLINRRAVCMSAPSVTRAGIVSERPALNLGALSSGQSTTGNVDFALDEDMSCGSRIALDFRGAVHADGFSDTGESHVAAAQLGGDGGTCDNTVSCPADPVPAVVPDNGILYNPNRSGNGMEVQTVGEFVALLWYTARPDHKPIWYFNAGRYGTNQVVSDLKRFQFNGQFTASDPSSEIVGESIVTWLTPRDVLFLWDFGDGAWGEQMIWFRTDNDDDPDPDVTRQWFNPDESGWGFVFNRQDDTDIQTMYIYDAVGDPVWLLNPNVYESGVGVMRTFLDVHCPGCPWTPARPADSGSIEFDFSAPDAGTVTVDIDLAPPLNGQWQRTDMDIQPIQ